MSLIRTLNLNSIGDERGQLVSLESFKNIPFEIKRVYYIFSTQMNIRRGFHAHQKLEQVCVCVNGYCSILLDDSTKKEIIQLNSPNIGLFIGSMLWREIFDFSHDCVLMVLASDYYDESDYIRDYELFVSQKTEREVVK